MFCRNYPVGSRIFIVWGLSCLILGILISSLPDFIIQVREVASLFPNESLFSRFHGFSDGFSLVLIIVSLILNLKAVRRFAQPEQAE